MKKTEKEKMLKFLTEELKASKISILAEFSRLSVKEMEELRKEMKKHLTKVMVVKNTLVKMAIQSCSMDKEVKSLEGPNMLIWSRTGDETEIIKELLKFEKLSGTIKVKFGIMNNNLMEYETLEKFSKIPPKRTLQAMVIGNIRAPLTNLAYNVKYPLTRLIMVLKTFSEQKEKKNG